MLDYLPYFIPQPVDAIHHALLIGWLTATIALLMALAALLLDYFISFVKWCGQSQERRKEEHMRVMRQVLREFGTKTKEEDPPPIYPLRKQA